MEPLTIYLVKANVVISILFLFYLLMLKNEKSFWQNRFYLLFSLLLSLFLPLLPEVSFSHSDTIQREITRANPLNDLYTTIGNSQMVNTHVNTVYVAVKQGFTPPSLMQILAGAYLLVSLVLLVRLAIKLLKISMLIKKTDKQFRDGIYYCAYNGTAPFSFFKYLVINKQLFNDCELQQIISHEKVHIRQWHSIDILFAEIAHAILWVNPLMVYLKRCIKLNHEYIADGEVINSGADKKDYQLSILHSSLKRSAYQLTNLYSSSKIKTRIKMMNLKKSPNANAYKYAFVSLLVAASYFLTNPLSAGVLHKNVSGRSVGMPQKTGSGGSTTTLQKNVSEVSMGAPQKNVSGNSANVVAEDPLTAFEGVYQGPDNEMLITLTKVNNVLVAKELWDGHEFSLKQKSELEFAMPDGSPVKFTKDKDGNVTQAQAFGGDIWVKVARHFLIHPLNVNTLQKNVIGTAQDLKKFEGYYQMNGKNGAVIQIITSDNSLGLKQLWDDRSFDFTATGPVTFTAKENHLFTLKFTSDDAGRITQVLAFGKDVWVRSDNYQPPVEVKLPAEDLKKFEGYYEFRDRKGRFLQISATGDGLVLKQLWDNRQIDFAAKSPLDFFGKKGPGFVLQFASDNAGQITQVLAFGKDVWVRNDNYHPPVEIKLAALDLKKFEGKYEFKKRKGQFLQISATDSGLVLKQLWDNKEIDFVATGPLAFFAKESPMFTLQFTSDNVGGITQVLAFGEDVWDKVN